jgi:hypothetical protein
MATSKYDLVKLTIGYNSFVVPRKVAMTLFEAAQEEDFYKYETSWEKGKSCVHVKDIGYEENFIMVTSFTPAQFHMGRIAWQDKLREEEEKAKSNAST